MGYVIASLAGVVIGAIGMFVMLKGKDLRRAADIIGDATKKAADEVKKP